MSPKTPEQYALDHLGADYSDSWVNDYPEKKEDIGKGTFEVHISYGGEFEEKRLQELKNILGAEKYSLQVESGGCASDRSGPEITITYYNCTKL